MDYLKANKDIMDLKFPAEHTQQITFELLVNIYAHQLVITEHLVQDQAKKTGVEVVESRKLFQENVNRAMELIVADFYKDFGSINVDPDDHHSV